MAARERTIRKEVSFSGVGLHSGEKVGLVLRPAPAGAGVVFFRSDQEPPGPIPARIDFVTDNHLATTLSQGGHRVNTVEHLLAAVYGLEIDSLEVWVDGPELPSGDGSALVFVELLNEAGFDQLDHPREVFRLSAPCRVANGRAQISASPGEGEGILIDLRIDFPRLKVAEQEFRIELTPASFQREIAPARTFGFLEDLPEIQAQGKARGGSLENAVVISSGEVINPEGLRFPDEFARHKILDLVGDLALLGRRFSGRIDARYSGHYLNHQLVREIKGLID